MVYFDTSFVTPLFRSEATSAAVARVVRALPAREIAISQWTRLEFLSVLAREVRMGKLGAEAANEVDARFESAVGAFTNFVPDAGDFDLARRYVARFETGLRGGDALHLAIAANRDAEAIHSLDKTMIKAGALLGLPVSRGISAR